MKPIITNSLIGRCLNNGSLHEEGTYAYVSFLWECDETVSSIEFRWKSDVDSGWSVEKIPASGTSGSVDRICAGGNLSPETRYTYVISVATASEETIIPGTLKSVYYTIDWKTQGRGIGIGRTAELEGVCDIELQTRMLGGILQPVLPFGVDLNDVIIPNTYTSNSAASQKYINCPLSEGTFILKVESSGTAGQIIQTILSCDKIAPKTFVRFYYSSGWSEWLCSDAVEKILYDNANGGTGTITLSQSVTNFRYVDIFFTDNNGRGCGYTRVWDPNGKFVHLGLQEAAATTVFFRQTVYTISDKTLTPNIEAASIVRVTTSSGAVPTMGTNYIKITKIVGKA